MAGIRVRPVGVGSGSVGCCAGMAVVRSGRITLLWGSPLERTSGLDCTTCCDAAPPQAQAIAVGPVRWRPQTLLPDVLLTGRCDLASVIGWALQAKAAGWGHRRIGERLGIPTTTVRGWLRRLLRMQAPLAV
jgi:hypothetical protein